MSASLEILSPGFQAGVQDKGRPGLQEFGIPLCGSVSPHWVELGNALVGNKAEEAGIEFRIQGPSLKAVDGPVKLVVCGPARAEITARSDSGVHKHTVPGWRTFTLNPDEEVKIGKLEESATGFLAIGGGLDIAAMMGSKATYMRSAFGGFEGRLLQAGDVIELGESAEKLADEADKLLPSPPSEARAQVRVVLGPQADYFEDSAIEAFLDSDYRITTESDRMGARLDGPALSHKQDKGSQIVSDGVAPGTIQVPGNGQPIVLLNDGQTVGGYPKIATVISPDLHLIANALPGSPIHFVGISAHDACLIARQEHAEIQRLKKSIVAASANGFINLKALYESNLIGGVVDMGQPDHFPGHLEGDQ